jgi:hypothetical protein
MTVQYENVLEIHSPELKPGVHVEVILLLGPPRVPEKKRSFRALMGAGKGAFSSAEEADAFIRGERNQWE